MIASIGHLQHRRLREKRQCGKPSGGINAFSAFALRLHAEEDAEAADDVGRDIHRPGGVEKPFFSEKRGQQRDVVVVQFPDESFSAELDDPAFRLHFRRAAADAEKTFVEMNGKTVLLPHLSFETVDFVKMFCEKRMLDVQECFSAADRAKILSPPEQCRRAEINVAAGDRGSE